MGRARSMSSQLGARRRRDGCRWRRAATRPPCHVVPPGASRAGAPLVSGDAAAREAGWRAARPRHPLAAILPARRWTLSMPDPCAAAHRSSPVAGAAGASPRRPCRRCRRPGDTERRAAGDRRSRRRPAADPVREPPLPPPADRRRRMSARRRAAAATTVVRRLRRTRRGPGLGQRRPAGHPPRAPRRRLRLPRPRRQPIRRAAELQRIRALAIPPAYEKVWICPHAERPPAGDRARRARPQAVPLSPRLAARPRRRQVRAHARVRRRAAAHPGPRQGRSRRADRHAAAARDGARDDRPPARHDLRAGRQRRIRAQEQVVRADDAAQPPRRGRGSRCGCAFAARAAWSTRSRSRIRASPASCAAARRCRGRSCSSTTTRTARRGRRLEPTSTTTSARPAAPTSRAKDFRTWHGTVHALDLWAEQWRPSGQRAEREPGARRGRQAARQHGRRVQEVVRASARAGGARAAEIADELPARSREGSARRRPERRPSAACSPSWPSV